MSSLGSALSLLETMGAAQSETLVSSILDTAGLSVGAVARRTLGMALPYVYGGVEQGLSANEIQDILKTAGLGVRRSTLLGVIKTMRAEYGYPDYIPGSHADQYPDAKSFRFAIDRYNRKYNIHVSVHLRDPMTGEEDTAHITLSSDRLLTLDEIDSAVMSYGPALEGSAKLAAEYDGYTDTIGYTIDHVFVTP